MIELNTIDKQQEHLLSAYISGIKEFLNSGMCQLCKENRKLVRHHYIDTIDKTIDVWTICIPCNRKIGNVPLQCAPLFTIHGFYDKNPICYFCGNTTAESVKHHYVIDKDVYVVNAHRGCNANSQHEGYKIEHKQILNASEAAIFLGISSSALYRYLRQGLIDIKKPLGKQGSRHHWKFKLSSLKLFLQGNGQSAGAGQSTPESK